MERCAAHSRISFWLGEALACTRDDKHKRLCDNFFRQMIAKYFLIAGSSLVTAACIFGQAAVSSSTNPQELVPPPVSPTPSQTEAPAPGIPALDELDQAFK